MKVGNVERLMKTQMKVFFSEGEEGVALTEFVLTLPIFIILMAGIITLGQVGASSVAAKSLAYGAMWHDAQEQTTSSDWRVVTPRSKLSNPVKQVLGQVVSDSVGGFVGGLPGDFEVPSFGATASEGADGAIALEGHWGEARYFSEMAHDVSGSIVSIDNHQHLNNVDRATGGSTKQILGRSGSNKPRLALDDNMMANTSFDEFALSDLWDKPTSLKGLFKNARKTMAGGISDLAYDLISGSGFIPGAMAGIRYGRGVGVAESSVSISSRVWDYTATHRGVYVTALSPYTEGALNSEKVHWLFYVAGTQPNKNQRHILNLVSQNLETDDQKDFAPYWPTDYWPATGSELGGGGAYGGGGGGGTK